MQSRRKSNGTTSGSASLATPPREVNKPPQLHNHTMPRAPNGKRRQLTGDEKTAIVEKRAQGKPYAKIEKETGASTSTIARVLNTWDKENTTANRPRPGRPKKLSERDARRVVRYSDEHPRASLQDITESSTVNVSAPTVGRTLREYNRYVRICRKKPWLSVKNKLIRRGWARKYRKFKKEWWRRHVYTDEVYLQSSGQYQHPTARRPPGTAFEERNLAPTFVGEPLSIMFFAGFSSRGHTKMVAVRHRTEAERETLKDKLGLNSVQYVNEIIIPHLLPLYEKMGGIENGAMTIEDGASYHTSTYTRKFRLMNGVQRLPWAPHSPDMNPIENVWTIWKKRMRKIFQDPQSRPHGRDEIIKVAERVWEELPWSRIYKWIDGLPRRVRALARSGGGVTRW